MEEGEEISRIFFAKKDEGETEGEDKWRKGR